MMVMMVRGGGGYLSFFRFSTVTIFRTIVELQVSYDQYPQGHMILQPVVGGFVSQTDTFVYLLGQGGGGGSGARNTINTTFYL